MAATAGQVAFAGFAFDPDSRPGEEWGELENSLVAVPSVLFHRHGSEASLCFSAPASDLSAPDDALRRWSRQLDRLERPRASPRPVLDAPALALERPDGERQVASALTGFPGLNGAPAWSPDGLQIAFMAERAGRDHDIYIMTPFGSGRQRLTDQEGFEFDAAWRPTSD